MAVHPTIVERIAERYQILQPHLNERLRRLWAGAEAKSLGHGGIRAVSRATGMSPNTVKAGIIEFDNPEDHLEAAASIDKQRRAGGGRPSTLDLQPQLQAALDALMGGGSDDPLRWTVKSVRTLTREMVVQGFNLSNVTTGCLLKTAGYKHRTLSKGKQHPDRDGQFSYINKTCQAYFQQGQPVICLKTRKQAGDAEHNARSLGNGVYDALDNKGWDRLGLNQDTVNLNAAALSCWWDTLGKAHFEGAEHLLVTTHSNSSKPCVRLWRHELQRFANETGLTVAMLHYPAGMSRWSSLEHSMCTTINSGRVLASVEVMVECISATTSWTGSRTGARFEEASFNSNSSTTEHRFHGNWNYSTHPM